MPLFIPRLIWRSQINPLRGLSIQRAVSALEQAERGVFSDLQWIFRFIEKRDATLRATIERRVSAIKKLDWSIKVKKDIKEEDPRRSAAEEQAKRLHEAYDAVDNLREALEHLVLATFRGYCHLEKHFSPDGDVMHLEPVPQWHWARRTPSLDWLYNADATTTNSGQTISRENFIIREIPRPVDELALICFLRKGLSQKDWDGYVENFGIPPLFIEMPPNAPYDATQLYQAIAEKVAGDGRGALPAGAKVVPVEVGDRSSPFKEHIGYQDEQIVLAATSGKLTVLNDATGLGSGQSESHQDTFAELAESDALEISEILQKQFDTFVLKDEAEIMCYFELAAKDEVDVESLTKNLVNLKSAGFQAEAEEISEKTGIKLAEAQETMPEEPFPGKGPTNKPAAGKKPAKGGERVRNRKTRITEATSQMVGQAFRDDLEILSHRVGAISQIQDADFRNKKLRELSESLPNLLADLNASPAAAVALSDGALSELLNGLEEK